MLEIRNLSKTYANGTCALQGVDLDIPAGMFGLLGPNGAGKSSLMRTIATLQLPDAGTIRFEGIDVLARPQELREQLGYLPQEFGVYPRISAEALLDHLAALKGIPGGPARRELVHEMLRLTNLWDQRRKSVAGFSGGMRQRFGVAQALIGSPRLLIVDEPTAGLDPLERQRFFDLICDVGESTAVILSTHLVEDVRELCAQMAILCEGGVVLSGRPDDTIATLAGRVWKRRVARQEVAGLRAEHTVISTCLRAGQTLVHVLADNRPAQFEPVEPDLEDVYFATLADQRAAPAGS